MEFHDGIIPFATNKCAWKMQSRILGFNCALTSSQFGSKKLYVTSFFTDEEISIKFRKKPLHSDDLTSH